MASVFNTASLSARLASRHACRRVQRRGFRVAAQDRAAQNFTMPALSPTMTEGNIASWRMKEGDSYTAGDVILEIETDKATMDVEAQDDGMLFKIMKGDGSKGVKVGDRIAIMAEEGDDLSSLEMPEENKDMYTGPKSKEEDTEPASEDAARVTPTASNNEETAMSGEFQKPVAELPPKVPGKKTKISYPYFPSVLALLRENGISDEDVRKIAASGPGGRLLKGDVLAHLGFISKDYPASIAELVEKRAHLDLTHIVASRLPPIQEARKEEPKAAPAAPELPSETEIAVPISLSAVIATQKRVNDTLGIFLPLSTFIARASELANEALPASRNQKPSTDDLFNSVLGLDKVVRSQRGHFIPQVTGLPPAPLVASARSSKKPDIIDMLAPRAAKSKTIGVTQIPGALGIAAGDNIFSVTAKTGEETRATEYLDRLKLALEKEPGRLVL